jgi:hypothetical protein
MGRQYAAGPAWGKPDDSSDNDSGEASDEVSGEASDEVSGEASDEVSDSQL